jgi:tRNA threonylcarbamoyladenosine biosynthesis protein TsaB
VSNEELTKAQPLILAIETATRAGGVAVARGEEVLASIAGDASVSHSTNLLEMVEEALRNAGATLAVVDLFAVAVGPGSFTGLRIGLATAKAFATHLNREVVGVSTLAAVAHASKVTGNIVALLPAGRGEVFAQRFTVREGTLTMIDDAQHLSPDRVIKKYDGLEALTFAGDGVQMIEKFEVPPEGISDITQRLAPEVVTPNTWTLYSESPSLAPSIAVLGFREYTEGKSVAPDNLRAVYVRASDAEINERWQQQRLQQQAGK